MASRIQRLRYPDRYWRGQRPESLEYPAVWPKEVIAKAKANPIEAASSVQNDPKPEDVFAPEPPSSEEE